MFIWILCALVAVILIILTVFTYLFFFAFVRRKQKTGASDTFFGDGELKDFEEVIKEGIRYNETEPFDKVYTTSYDGLRLAGKRYKCTGEHKGTIILFHGYRSRGVRDFSCAVKEYRDFGLDVLMVDMRSHGESQGKLITFGAKERYDVITWTNFVLQNSPDERIFYSGLSMGGATVLMATELGLPKQVKGIVADCGFSSPYDILRCVAKSKFKINGALSVPFLGLFCKIIGGFTLKSANTINAVKKCTTPILFIHGKKDDFVPAYMSVNAYESATCKKRLLLVENAGHGTSYLRERELVANALRDLVNENI